MLANCHPQTPPPLPRFPLLHRYSISTCSPHCCPLSIININYHNFLLFKYSTNPLVRINTSHT